MIDKLENADKRARRGAEKNGEVGRAVQCVRPDVQVERLAKSTSCLDCLDSRVVALPGAGQVDHGRWHTLQVLPRTPERKAQNDSQWGRWTRAAGPEGLVVDKLGDQQGFVLVGSMAPSTGAQRRIVPVVNYVRSVPAASQSRPKVSPSASVSYKCVVVPDARTTWASLAVVLC